MPLRWQRSSAASREMKRGLPQRPEAVAVADRGDAAEQGVDEDRPPVRAEADVVHVEVAGHPGRMRRIDRVEALLIRLARRQHIVEAVDLIMGGEREAAPVGARRQPHRAGEGPLEDRKPPVRPRAEEEDLARLIGGEGEAAAGSRQPLREMARRGQRELFLACGGCHLHAFQSASESCPERKHRRIERRVDKSRGCGCLPRHAVNAAGIRKAPSPFSAMKAKPGSTVRQGTGEEVAAGISCAANSPTRRHGRSAEACLRYGKLNIAAAEPFG